MATLDLPRILTSDPPSPNWIVEGFLPANTVTILGGAEGTGKSSLAYALSLSVTLGAPFLQLPTRRRRVLYFDSENSLPDCTTYLRQLWIGLGHPDPTTLSSLRVEHFSLGRTWKDRFKHRCQEWAPHLIIVDTANSCFGIQDENSNAEAADILASLHVLRPPDSSIVLLKHEREPREGRGQSVRGAKYWLGAVDQVVYLHRIPGRPVLSPYPDAYKTLYKTRLTPAKHRAYGLGHPITIVPHVVRSSLGNGILFRAEGEGGTVAPSPFDGPSVSSAP